MPNDLAVWNGSLTVAAGNTVRLWDPSQRAWSGALEGHRETVNVVAALSAQLASGSRDETVRVWADGQCAHVLQGHTHHVLALIGLPDHRLASSSNDCTVRVWDTRHGVCLWTLEGHTRSVEVLAFHGKLISRARDQTLRVWDIESGACMHSLQSPSKSVNDLTVLPVMPGMIASCSAHTVQLWDIHAGAMCCVVGSEQSDYAHEVLSVAVLPDGKLAAGSGGMVHVWE